MIHVKRLVPHARLPERQHNSAGYDLYASEDITIPPGQVGVVSLGIASAFPDFYVALVWDRSGMGKKGLTVFGGVIDSDYRGEWKVLLYNSTGSPFDVHRGDRIAQVLFQPVQHFPVVEVEELTNTSRGTGGLGSTGK
jgi:dUTP pyrophosphatase